MTTDRRDDDTWQWLQLATGWAIYEQLEREAICAESQVPRRIAANLAQQQVGAAGYSQAGRPW